MSESVNPRVSRPARASLTIEFDDLEALMLWVVEARGEGLLPPNYRIARGVETGCGLYWLPGEEEG